jgi:LPS sulfotransferase NodH
VRYVEQRSGERSLPTTAISAHYLADLLSCETTPAGVFSTKLHWLQVNQLVDALRGLYPAEARRPAPELIAAALPNPRYLYLSRREKARQALSMFNAMRSGQWWQPATKGGPRPVVAPDHLAIRWFEDHLTAEDAEWRRYFEVFGIDALEVVYEDLVADPSTVIQTVLDGFGVTGSLPTAPPRVTRQADGHTERTLTEYAVLRAVLPARPRGWRWSFARQAFGLPDPVEQPDLAGPPGDLSPL